MPWGDLEEWHTYTMEWKPKSISWIFDGKLLLTLDDSHEAVRLMKKSQKLMMNIWPPSFSPWGDNFDPSKMPFVVQYDYVKVWSYEEATDSFQFKWVDEFDSFDNSRWLKSNMWSFGGNKCTFS